MIYHETSYIFIELQHIVVLLHIAYNTQSDVITPALALYACRLLLSKNSNLNYISDLNLHFTKHTDQSVSYTALLVIILISY